MTKILYNKPSTKAVIPKKSRSNTSNVPGTLFDNWLISKIAAIP
jgi:hypothetical protein